MINIHTLIIEKNIMKTSNYRLKMMQERYEYCIKNNFKTENL